MQSFKKSLPLFALSLLAVSGLTAATFGTVIPIRGQVADIALDAKRRVIYAANFPANRIEVISLDSQAVQNPISVAPQPSSLALSPDGRYLVIGHYVNTTNSPAASTGLTILNLETSQKQVLSFGATSVLTVAFGNSPKAILVMSDGVSLLDPATMAITRLSLTDFSSTPLPVPWSTFSPEIIKASAGVSGDGNVIYALVDGSPQSVVIEYQIATGHLTLVGATTSPQLGPRVVSVDGTGASVLAGWALLAPLNSSLVVMAQFPYPPGILNQGGHVFDTSRNLIYAQVAPGAIQTGGVGAAGAPLLHLLDSDNLTVREILQLRENLAGKALLSGDTMYAVSESGLTTFPMGSLLQTHRVKSLQEDLVIQANGCDQQTLTQYLDIVDPSGGATDFTLTVSSPGVRIAPSSGTTPARVQITVDPTAFQASKGTTVVPVQISSAQAVNLPLPVRLLINTRDPDQQGAVHMVSGKIVDVLADPARDRFYVLRQDLNEVLVFDGTSFEQTGFLRTGNTPVQMAISQDKLLVTNDNSQYVSVFDLPTLTTLAPVFFPPGFFARSIAVSRSQILTTTRSASGPPAVMRIDLQSRTATKAFTGIFGNSIDVNSAVAGSPSGGTIFMTMPNGTVALYDDSAGTFVASRKDTAGLSGAYGALSDDVFTAGGHLFNSALVPVGQIDLFGGVSSGLAIANGQGLLTSTPAAAQSGVIQRFSMSSGGSVSPTRTPEAPLTALSLTTSPVGQIGQTILPFTRTLAPLANAQSVVQLSTSGFSVLLATFDAPRQQPVINAITNAADLGPMVAAGGLITLWGTGMSEGNAAASTVPLPRGLGGVCLYSNSVPLPLLFVSPGQINAQLPFNFAPGSSVTISSTTGQSASFNVAMQPLAPAIFKTASGGPVIVRIADGRIVSDSSPIRLDDKLIIYMTGMGPVSATPNAGDVPPSKVLATTNVVPSITIGGADIWTLWSGLAPGFVGIYQINAQVPFKKIPTGSQIPFTVTQGGVSTTVKLRVE